MTEDLQRKLKGKQIMIICPKYFGYEARIVNRLQELGSEVFYIDERPDNTSLAKIFIRLFPFLYVLRINAYYNDKIKKIVAFDILLMINPESISLKILNRIKGNVNAAEYILYMWDSFSNKKHAKKIIQFFDKIVTFDPDDARKMNIMFRPLFFCSQKHTSNTKQKTIDISFIGTGHSDRAKIINTIQKQWNGLDLNCFFYLYLQTPLIFYWNKLTNKSFIDIPKSMFHFKPLQYDKYEEIVELSEAVIDIEHPSQKGLTMRTFEMLGKRKKLITTNKHIKEYDFYDDSNISIIDRLNPLIDEAFIHKEYCEVAPELYYKYSIDGWLEDVLFKTAGESC